MSVGARVLVCGSRDEPAAGSRRESGQFAMALEAGHPGRRGVNRGGAFGISKCNAIT